MQCHNNFVINSICNIQTLKRASSTTNYAYYSSTNRVQNTDGSGDDYRYDGNGNIVYSLYKGLTNLDYDPFTQMTMQIDRGSKKRLKFQYDGSNRRVYKQYRKYIKGGPVQQKSTNTTETSKFVKGTSYEQQIIETFSGYSPSQTSGKMVSGYWDYTTTLYLHGEGNNVLVEYTKGTTTPEYKPT